MTRTLSVIICCFNSSTRITPTLECLSRQFIPNDLVCELLIVDNKSTDNIKTFCQELWLSLESPFALRFLEESRAGTGYARQKGLLNTESDFVIFLDDDNHLHQNYIKNVFNIFKTKMQVAICGGCSKLPSNQEYKLPFWWNDFKHAYAVGPLGKTGFVDKVVTAGMGLRMEAYRKLMKHNYRFLLSGRKGDKILAAGEDNEICHAIRLLGYKIYYSSDLKFDHAIDPARINEQYLIRLYQDNGLVTMYLSAYVFTLRLGRHSWWREWFYVLFLVLSFSFSFTFASAINYKRVAFKHKIKLIINVVRMQSLLRISFSDYNQICHKILTLKSLSESNFVEQ